MGPHETRDAARDGFTSSPQWSDNVTRMHQFMSRHSEVVITTPMTNGTAEFRAHQGGEVIAADTSLGWLMDQVEKRYDRPAG
jgi:hypothetical protein